jgi:drug/metabolite transporter (DMT)-like permease
MIPAQRRALVALFVGAICIGLAPIFVRIGAVGPSAAAFWRTFLALPLLALLPRSGGEQETRREDRHGLWIAGLCFAADLAVWHRAIGYTSVANATLLANLSPVFVALALRFFFHERYHAKFWLGLAFGLGGAGLLVAESFSISTRGAFGDSLGVVAAVFYAGYQIAVSRVRQRCSTRQVMLATSAVTAAVLLPIVLLTHETMWPPDTRGWLVLLALAAISHVGGQGLIAYALAGLPAAFASVGLLVQPVAATLFAWALLGERCSGLQALGGIIVLGGILLCRLATQQTAKQD